MSGSNDVKDLLKWVGVAVLAAIPVYLLLKKFSEEPESLLGDPTDIFAEELQG